MYGSICSFEGENEEKEEDFMKKAVEKTLADVRLREEGRARCYRF